jgi:hypothetical protein
MGELEDDERIKYGQFVEILNTMRREDLITAKERRELDKRWRTEPDHRDIILEEIERLTDEHNEKLISGDSQ